MNEVDYVLSWKTYPDPPLDPTRWKLLHENEALVLMKRKKHADDT
jgi:hypothetical protein